MIVNCISMFILFIISCSSASKDLVKQYAIVYNTRNVNNIVDLYTDDAIFEVVDQFSLIGKAQIKNLTDYDSVLNINMFITDIQEKGDTVFCCLSETNDWLKICGIDTAFYNAAFAFENGFIKHLKVSAKPETRHDFYEIFTHLIEWAKENEANLLSEIMPESKFIYNAETAKKTLILFRAWLNNI